MGLDWVVERHRPRKGKEAEFKRRKAKLEALAEAGAEEAELDGAREALAEVSHSPFEDIGAPRVGHDARATKWFLEGPYAEQVARAKAQGAPVPSRAEALAAAHGQYVLELAKKQGGVAGGSFLVSGIDYGAGIIDRCTDVVGDPSEAWVDHTAAEAARFAKRLEADLEKAKSPEALRAERLAARAKARGPLGRAIAASGTTGGPVWVARGFRAAMSFDDQVNTVKALIAWLKFWSGLGYGFKAWS